MRKRDSLYQQYKKKRTPKTRQAFLDYTHKVKHHLKISHDQYINSILGLSQTDDQENPQMKSTFTTKKLFSLLNRSKQDSTGIPPLMKNGVLHTDTVTKSNILNEQFQSVFTPRSPLRLQQLSNMAVRDYID